KLEKHGVVVCFAWRLTGGFSVLKIAKDESVSESINTIMKTQHLFALATAAVLGFTACEKKTDTTPNAEKKADAAEKKADAAVKKADAAEKKADEAKKEAAAPKPAAPTTDE